jgi:hypothetical protein
VDINCKDKLDLPSPRTRITKVVNNRIRRRMRSYTVVYGVNYDRIRPYFVVLLDARITTVSRRVVYDHRIRSLYTTVHCRIRHRLSSYSHKFLVSEGGNLLLPPSPPPPPTHQIPFTPCPFLLLSSTPPLSSLSLISKLQKYLPLLVPMRWI